MKARSVTKLPGSKLSTTDLYVSLHEVDDLIQSGRAHMRERLAAADILSIDEAAAFSGKGVADVEAAAAKGELLGLFNEAGHLRLPRWQFEPAFEGIWKQLAEALDTNDPWQLLTLLETPLGSLGGLTPRAAVERGLRKRVMAVVGYD